MPTTTVSSIAFLIWAVYTEVAKLVAAHKVSTVATGGSATAPTPVG